MKLMMKLAFLAAALVVGQSNLQAQAASRSSNERSRLHFLVGSFTTETIIPPAPGMAKGASGKGTCVISWALDSMYVFIEDQSENSLLGHYKAHGVLGYDRQTRQYVLSMFNNFGDSPSYKGSFVNDTLVLETRIPFPGRSFNQKLSWFKDGPAVRLRIANDLGQGFITALEQTATPAAQQ